MARMGELQGLPVPPTGDAPAKQRHAVELKSRLIAPKDALKKGEVYNVSVRMFMDRDFLSKPLQVNAINDSSWRLSTNRKTFTYRAE